MADCPSGLLWLLLGALWVRNTDKGGYHLQTCVSSGSHSGVSMVHPNIQTKTFDLETPESLPTQNTDMVIVAHICLHPPIFSTKTCNEDEAGQGRCRAPSDAPG